MTLIVADLENYKHDINDTVDLVLFFSLRPQYAAVGDCCYPICCGALLRIDIKSTESLIPSFDKEAKKMKIKIITVGKTKEKFLQFGEKEFQQRLARYCQIEWITVKEEKIIAGKSDQQIKANEAERILEKIAPKSWKVALDRTGKPMSSEDLAAWLQKKMNEGTSEFEFIIGGALGLDPIILNSVNQVLSLSQMTFTHEMSRLILLEQLYRAFTILRGEKYHK